VNGVKPAVPKFGAATSAIDRRAMTSTQLAKALEGQDKRLKEIEDNLVRERAILEKKEQDAALAQSLVSEKSKHIEQLQHSVAQIETAKLEVASALERERSERDSFFRETQSLREQLTAAQSESAKAAATIIRVEAQVESLTKDAARSKEEMDSVRAQLDDSRADNDRRRRQIEGLDADIADLEKRLRNEKSERADAEEQVCVLPCSIVISMEFVRHDNAHS
jgi:chromosome segregation ATPase